MTRKKPFFTLRDKTKLKNNRDQATVIMKLTKNYYQLDALEQFTELLPKQAIILELDEQLSSHMIYFAKYASAEKIYVPTEERKKEVQKNMWHNHIQQVETVENDPEAWHTWLPSVHLIHFSKRIVHQAMVEQLLPHLANHAVLWLETENTDYDDLLATRNYHKVHSLPGHAVYTFQAQQTAAEQEDSTDVEKKVLAWLETYKGEIDEIANEFAKQQINMEAKHQRQLEKQKQLATKKWNEQVTEHQKELHQLTSQLTDSYAVVQYISDAWNAEKMVNHDLNQRIYTLLEAEKPVLLALKERNIAQQKELAILRQENKQLTKQWKQLHTKYERLNNTKVIRFMRKYWHLKKSRKLRNDT
ncbi:hypothetical protein HB847_14910 [Listeria booriae]|uniref:Uncharacterized protein n=1 Tax=Listeria booriae TaxID=1552123 RepID=A0A841Y9P7_9LIST|nr:hypothetical protein [Listeria booriae]MBC1373643.1 hypothetical protein [Listeria booriae]